MQTYRVVVIRGDGIGPEIMDAALAELEPIQKSAAFSLALEFHPAGAGEYRRTGRFLSTGSARRPRPGGWRKR